MAATPDELREVRKAYSVVYLELIKVNARDSGAILVCLEGHDAAYFRPRLMSWLCARALANELELFNCGGKDEVLKVRDAIDRNPSLQRALCIFIIDRDYGSGDEAQGRTDTFVTDGYSTENYYFGPQFIRHIVEEFIYKNRLEADDRSDVRACCRMYGRLQGAYFRAIQPFNEWAFAVKTRAGPRTRLSAFDQSSFIVVDLGANVVAVAEDKRDFNLVAEVAEPVTEDELAAAKNWSRRSDPALDFRGKQHAIFVLNVLAEFSSAARAGTAPFSRAIRQSMPNSLKTFLRDLSHAASSSPRLWDFLNQFYDERLPA